MTMNYNAVVYSKVPTCMRRDRNRTSMKTFCALINRILSHVLGSDIIPLRVACACLIAVSKYFEGESKFRNLMKIFMAIESINF